jgi:hypothetical protein
MISHCSTNRTGPSALLLGQLLALVLTSSGFAQERSPAAVDAKTPPSTINPLTGKERLGRKWMDEQRIDNCKIPLDKQGSKPRSSVCSHVPTG